MGGLLPLFIFLLMNRNSQVVAKCLSDLSKAFSLQSEIQIIYDLVNGVFYSEP